MKLFLWGALAMASTVAGLYFWRFWKESRDRLFVFFSAAFCVLALNWLGLAVTDEPETRHWVYALRLVAFVLIIVGIVDKNRRGRAG